LVAVIFTHLGLVLFLAWGIEKPQLERVWELHHELKIGTLGKLDQEDHRLLSAAMGRHPNLAEELLSDGRQIGLVSAQTYGWLETEQATALRAASAKGPCRAHFEVSIPNDALPLTIKLAGSSWHKDLSIERQGTSSFELPPNDGKDEIIDLQITTSGPHDEVATLGVRVDFSCASEQKAKGHD
jgi:hypothetical protein